MYYKSYPLLLLLLLMICNRNNFCCCCSELKVPRAQPCWFSFYQRRADGHTHPGRVSLAVTNEEQTATLPGRVCLAVTKDEQTTTYPGHVQSVTDLVRMTVPSAVCVIFKRGFLPHKLDHEQAEKLLCVLTFLIYMTEQAEKLL